MLKRSQTNGFTKQKWRNGEVAMYWIASRAIGQRTNYRIKTLRLKGSEEEARAQCARLTQELIEWLTRHPEKMTEYTGTMASLVDCYTGDEDSPYRNVRENTRASYDYDLRIIRRSVGERRVADLTRKDFAAWHRNLSAPKAPGRAPRIRRAHGVMNMIRMILGYGKSMRYAGCRDALDIISEMAFEQSARRDRALTFDQASAIIDAAIAKGSRSIALGQALQFELGLRQSDVVGRWTENQEGAGGGITFRGTIWSGGLTWSDLSSDRLAKRTSKTGQEGNWSPNSYPLIVKAMAAFAEHERVGPAVVDERTGKPYKDREYAKVWRPIATAAGVPLDVWNMDSRAGALTEASEAGAAPEDIRKFATHANFKTTERYLRRTGESTDRVAELRKRLRERK